VNKETPNHFKSADAQRPDGEGAGGPRCSPPRPDIKLRSSAPSCLELYQGAQVTDSLTLGSATQLPERPGATTYPRRGERRSLPVSPTCARYPGRARGEGAEDTGAPPQRLPVAPKF
jgi:hypothetical protein